MDRLLVVFYPSLLGRSVGGGVAVHYGIELFKTFYSRFRELDTQISKQIEA